MCVHKLLTARARSAGVWWSSRQRNSLDRLTYQQLGGVACHLAYTFISQSTTILAAFYQWFQVLNYDSYSDTIEEEPAYSSMVQTGAKDDFTWAKARMSSEYNKFRDAALKEVQSLEGKESWGSRQAYELPEALFGSQKNLAGRHTRTSQ